MHCIGLMSGTSLDGVDGVLCSWDGEGRWRGVAACASRPFAPALRAEFEALQRSGADELHRAALAGNALARLYAEVVQDLLERSGLAADAIAAIGAHGQTVRHQPQRHDGTGYTWQLLQPALLAERCGIDVIADFRVRDLAAGGQGAPLVPPFHQAVFGDPARCLALLNLGGIANLTVLRPGDPPRGWDTGPANVLMDGWAQRHLGQPYDERGRWAATGQADAALLAQWLAEPYFALPPPKSTGRDLFDATWLDQQLAAWARPLATADVQATLAALTVASVTADLRAHAPDAQALLVCGGGALNDALMRRLAAALPPGVALRSTAEAGLPPLQVEAAAFAWLARQHLLRRPASEPAVTGARGPRILGACHPGR